jgi:hypothetical protein
MAADRHGRPAIKVRPPGTPSARVRLRGLLIVVAVMVLLTAGWPLLNALVADKQVVAAGTALQIGPGGLNSASVRVGPQWSLRPAESNPREGYVLSRGAVAVSIEYVTLEHAEREAVIWGGLRQVLRVSHPGVSLGPPKAVTSSQGREGRTAMLTSTRSIGAVAVFVAPSGTYAIQMIVLAPRGVSPIAAGATRQFLRTLRFPAEPRSVPVLRSSPVGSSPVRSPVVRP